MNIVRIAEQFSKLKDDNEFKILEEFSSNDLKGLSAVRYYISHDYDSTDDNIIENVIRYNLPVLKNTLKSKTLRTNCLHHSPKGRCFSQKIDKEFLGDGNSDPRNDLINQMLNDISPTGSVVAYNQSFEMSRIKELANYNQNKKDELHAFNERFVDLIVPFRGRGYYHPDFNGSFSIKSILPAMFPNDPELDYKKLGSIQNGGDAMDTFANLHLLKDKSKLDNIRKDLLAYCHLDTLAMVRI